MSYITWMSTDDGMMEYTVSNLPKATQYMIAYQVEDNGYKLLTPFMLHTRLEGGGGLAKVFPSLAELPLPPSPRSYLGKNSWGGRI